MVHIVVIGLLQCLIFLALNLQKRKKSSADQVLLLWLIVFAAHLLVLLLEALTRIPVALQIFSKTIVLLHGPILLLYANLVFNGRSMRHTGLHITPFVLLSTSGLVFQSSHYVIWQDILLLAKLASILIYPLVTVHWLHHRKTQLRNENSNNIVLEISWVRTLAYLLLGSYLISLIFVLFNQLFGWNLDNNLDLVFYVAMITIMGYYGLKLGVVFSAEGKRETKTALTKKSYQHSPLSQAKMQGIEKSIARYFSSTQAYLNSDFSLQMLSESVKVPKHHLSQVINDHMKTSFYDWVNAHRIHYAKEKILAKSKPQQTLESLGYEAGFNTKAAFFFHFKKVTGKTPGQFKKEMSID